MSRFVHKTFFIPQRSFIWIFWVEVDFPTKQQWRKKGSIEQLWWNFSFSLARFAFSTFVCLGLPYNILSFGIFFVLFLFRGWGLFGIGVGIFRKIFTHLIEPNWYFLAEPRKALYHHGLHSTYLHLIDILRTEQDWVEREKDQFEWPNGQLKEIQPAA